MTPEPPSQPDPQNPPPDATGRRGKGKGKGTTGRASARDVAAVLLAAGSTIQAAAETAGVGERTLQRWAADSGFQAQVRGLREKMVDSALGKLSESMLAASEVLQALLTHGDATERRMAAAKIIELALRVREQADLSDRLAKVEEQLAAGSADAPPETTTGGTA